MSRLRVAVALALLPTTAAAAPAPVGPIPPPNTWAVSSQDGTFLFVMRGTTSDEADHPAICEKIRERSRELWATYPHSGLYNQFTRELLWATDERLELRSRHQLHHVVVTPTGSVVWLAHPPGLPMKLALPDRAVLDAVPFTDAYSLSADGLGLRILTEGKTVATATAEGLLADPTAPAEDTSLGYKRWLADMQANNDTLTVTTLDEQTVTFDLTTGAELHRRPPHRPNYTRWGVLLGGVLLASSVGLARARKRPIRTPAASALPTPPVAELFPEPDPLIVTPPPPGLSRRRSGWHVPVRR